MPLTAKGEEILKSMKEEYGTKKAKEVFFSSVNSGKITGAEGDAKDEAGEIIPASITIAELQKKNEEYWNQGYVTDTEVKDDY